MNTIQFEKLYDYDVFRKAIVNLAINDPEAFQLLMLNLPHLRGYRRWVNPYVSLYNKRVSYGWIGGGHTEIEPVSDEEAIERFIERSAKERADGILHEQELRISGRLFIDSKIEEVVKDLQCNDAIKAIVFLLENTTDDIRQKFWDNFLNPEELAKRAHADIIVRRIENDGMMKGNLGRYLIYAHKDGYGEQQLHFTHQASCVYYLMFLISRHQQEGFLLPLDLMANKKVFMALYHEVYDITEDKLRKRFQELIFREEGNNLRAGRTKQLIYDIKKQVTDCFMEFDENPSPYVMTSFRHLEIEPNHILFECDNLLSFKFT